MGGRLGLVLSCRFTVEDLDAVLLMLSAYDNLYYEQSSSRLVASSGFRGTPSLASTSIR